VGGPRGGYAILALLVLGVLGATLAPGGIRNRQRAPQRLLAAALLVGAAMSLLWPSLRSYVVKSGEPVTSPASPTGVWVYDADTQSLEANGSYACRGVACTGLGPRGTWRVTADRRLIVRWNDGREVSWRIVRYNGRDRLGLSPTPGTGATSDAGLTFARVSP